MVKRSTFFITLFLLLVGFGVAVYLQDLKHQESTQVYWNANRQNTKRLVKVQNFNSQLNKGNWRAMKDSIHRQLDTLIILRFRKEVDSINQSQKIQ